MRKVITSFSNVKMPEGNKLVGAYSIIDEKGDYVAQNQRFSKLAVDEKIIEAINTIESFLESAIPED